MNDLSEIGLNIVNNILESNLNINKDDVIIYFNINNDNYKYLSHWYHSPFVAYNIKFPTVEHYIIYMKALLFNDYNLIKLICNNCISKNPSPSYINAIGRYIIDFDENIWNSYKINIIYIANILKFTQNPDLKYKLISTNNITIYEEPYNYIKHNNYNIPCDSDYTVDYNILGFIIMIIRNNFIYNNIIDE